VVKEKKSGVMKLSLLRPVDSEWPVSSPYGMREHPISRKSKKHNGIDFSVPVGIAVKAMAGGRVFRSGWENDRDFTSGFGLRVWQTCKIDGYEYYLWYGHLGKIEVVEDQNVKEGDTVGYSGNTGNSSGPHLHVQARRINTGDFYDMEFYDERSA